jgi:hypothetical protein
MRLVPAISALPRRNPAERRRRPSRAGPDVFGGDTEPLQGADDEGAIRKLVFHPRVRLRAGLAVDDRTVSRDCPGKLLGTVEGGTGLA